MERIEKRFSDFHSHLNEIKKLANACNPGIVVYRDVTIEVKFDSSQPYIFDKLISWTYSLINEGFSKHYDFLLRQTKKLGLSISNDANGLKEITECIRLISQHSIFDIERLERLKDQKQAWFQSQCGKNQPVTTEDWDIILNTLLKSIDEVLSCFKNTIKMVLAGEFRTVFITEWEKLALRTFSKHEYRLVLEKVLNNHGFDGKIDPELFLEKYLNTWQTGIQILPDNFDFESSAYSLIEKTFIKADIIPISGEDLIKAGIPKSQMLGKCVAEAKRSFYENPCTPEELILRTLNWYKQL